MLKILATTVLLVCGSASVALARNSLQVRLKTPLTSYTATKKMQVLGVVIAPYSYKGRLLMPQGTSVVGEVRRVNRVGLGLIHERAAIDLTFHSYQLPDGRRFPMKATVRHIDNARETVTKQGEIKGILAANNPQSFLHGVWHRPRLGAFPRSFVGLTGASGKISSSFSMGPIGASALFAARIAMFRMPEPEIQLPPGVELKLTVAEFAESAPFFEPSTTEPVDEELSEWLREQPVAVTKPDGGVSTDLINLAFSGSREELIGAFRAAGWHTADPLTTRTFARAYKSYTRQMGYPTAPVSKLLYLQEEPDLIFQKSFNTISKRHHIRIWHTEREGEEIWLAAATHDIGIEFDSGAMNFTHKIDPRIDRERSKVINDLIFTGCAAPAYYIERAGAVRIPEDASGLVSDGRLAAVVLHDSCAELTAAPPFDEPKPPKSRAGRIVRRMMLEGRQYILRGNAYYWGYRALTHRRHSKQQLDQID